MLITKHNKVSEISLKLYCVFFNDSYQRHTHLTGMASVQQLDKNDQWFPDSPGMSHTLFLTSKSITELKMYQ